MLSSIFRCLTVYAVLIFSVRIMGKREIGQLQPADLVITILISNIASLPVEQPDISLLKSVAVIIFLSLIEILMSLITMKLSKFRHVIQGNSLLIIKDGKINQKILKRMRLTVDDLVEGLRLKDVFDISEVEYAYVETNGQLSVKLKDEKSPPKAEQLKIVTEDNGIPFVLISDGRLISDSLNECNLTKEELDRLLKSRRLDRKDILILTADRSGIKYIVCKDKKGE